MPSFDTLVTPAPYRALVIDDEVQICTMLVGVLGQSGWDVVVGTRVSEAELALKDKSRTLDLVMLDIKLPDGDGMKLIPLAQSRRDQPDVVIMTGYPTPERMLEALRLGVLDFIYKPFTIADIGNMLRRRTIRERIRLGLMAERFERVDDEFKTVHSELKDIRGLLDSVIQAQALRRSQG